ncbi:nuclear transport factor 2 family protein [Prauserella alba]|uniref:DUF4440 domain-containing protein n=1 Tax=Prauserella alba TaxID=176898 RepID=A0ABP4G3Q3_9PSEU|nr:nuclear transport factor 2 family protein [Prauserella alba]MCP2181890.1 protein of unknown function (DUF4440) [Prauserella alba]
MNNDATPGTDEAATAELLTTGDNWARAIVSNDPDRIAGFTADEWVIVSDTGITSKEQFLSVVRSGELTHSTFDRVDDARVRFYGDTAILTTRITNTANFRGQQFDADEWTTDVFVRRDGHWSCVLSHVTAATSA